MGVYVTITSTIILVCIFGSQCYLRLGKRSTTSILSRRKDSDKLTKEVLAHLNKIFQENLDEKIAEKKKKIYNANIYNKIFAGPKARTIMKGKDF